VADAVANATVADDAARVGNRPNAALGAGLNKAGPKARSAGAESRGTPSPGATQPRYVYQPWLERLGEGELGPLGDVEVLSAVTEAGMAARASTESLQEWGEKRLWLKKLDPLMWGKAAIALSKAASEAAEMAEMVAMCESEDEVACRIVAEQQEQTTSVLDQLQVANWAEAAAVLSATALDMADVTSTAFAALELFGVRNRRETQQ